MRNLFVSLLFSLVLFCSFASAELNDYYYILSVSETSVYPTTIYPNSEVSLNLTLENISDATNATDVSIEINPNTNYFNEIKSTDALSVIKNRQTGTLSLRFKVKNDTPGGYYAIPYSIKYQRGGEFVVIDSQTSVTVTNYDKLNLVLTSYPTAKKYLDENVSISGYVKNEGNTTLKGISINTDFGTEKLIPLGEVTQFIGDLEPGMKKDYSISLIIPKTADIGVYDINITASDVLGNDDLERVSFIVEDKPTLIVSSIDKALEQNQKYLMQGSHFSLSIQLENISKSRAKSVTMAILETTTDIEGSTIAYVGSVDADDSGAGVFDLYITPTAKTGDQRLTVEITYLDEYDVEHSFTKDVSLFVDNAPKSNASIFYVILVIILLGIGYYVYSKYSKRSTIKKIQ